MRLTPKQQEKNRSLYQTIHDAAVGIVNGSVSPHDGGIKIWGSAMSLESEDTTPLWLLWANLTDWLEATPDDPEALKSTADAAADWLAAEDSLGARDRYYHRWLTEILEIVPESEAHSARPDISAPPGEGRGPGGDRPVSTAKRSPC